MFSTDSFIDGVQSYKKWFVNTYFNDSDVRIELCSFVDKQTDFVKQIVKTNDTLIKHLVKANMTKYTT